MDFDVIRAPGAGGGGLSAPVADGDLASPNNAVYRHLFRSTGAAGPEAPAGTYLLLSRPSSDLSNGSNWSASQAAETTYFSFVAAEYAVPGLTTKLNIRATAITNATAPGTISFAIGLYPITVAGGSDQVAITAGTVVPGSAATVTNPLLSTTPTATSGDFDVPSNGAFILAYVQTGDVAAASVIGLNADLRVRNV